MVKWKSPPKAKVFEALGAVLDGRVRIVSDGEAEVTSSSGDKRYSVAWIPGANTIGSNDNASFFQGYIGYPIIAVLLATGRIPFDPAIARPLAGVHWKQLNDRFKRNYDAAIEHVLLEAKVSVDDRDKLAGMVGEIYDRLVGLELDRPLGRGKRPPSSTME